MTDPGRHAAIDAVAAVLAQTPDGMDARTWAVACVNAAEAVWPHDPPPAIIKAAGPVTEQEVKRLKALLAEALKNPLHLLDSEEPHA